MLIAAYWYQYKRVYKFNDYYLHVVMERGFS